MKNTLRRDPTRLTSLRRASYSQVGKRLAGLRAAVRAYLGQLTPGTPIARAEAFSRWLQTAVDVLLDLRWLQGISYAAWLKGVVRSYDDVRKRHLKDPVAHLGAKGEFLRRLRVNSKISVTISRPTPTLVINQDLPVAAPAAVDVLARRLGMEFQGVFASAVQEAARVLLDGLLAGDNVTTIATAMSRVLADKLYNRLKRIVATELTRAHAKGQLQALDELDVSDVTALVEWDASDAACGKCLDLDGTVMSLEEAEGLIPLHPNCLCAWQPVEDDESED